MDENRHYQKSSMIRNLSPEILEKLIKTTKRAEATIRKDIALLGKKYGKLTPNARAQIYALQNGTSILQKLTRDEKNSLPNLEIEKPQKIKEISRKPSERKYIEFIKYETVDPFIKYHIIETNKTYTHGCYTATFILCRKILENLITGIIIKKFPKEQRTTEMYYDTKGNRKRDFSEIISNLKRRINEFGTDKGLIDRILNRAEKFKDNANAKTHSWYHIVKSKSEIDDTHVQDIIAMISKLEKNI